LNEFLTNEQTKSSATETELQRYLNEPRIDLHVGFDILEWRRTHGPRFPIVALMARGNNYLLILFIYMFYSIFVYKLYDCIFFIDILSIQISTVASESAFSTGRRVLDPYRTSLSSQLVEALLCTQDWIRRERMEINVDEIEDLLNDDEVVKEMEEAVRSHKGKQLMQH
jgi:hypothetical protein